MKHPIVQLMCLLTLSVCSCAAPPPVPTETATPPPTTLPPSRTPSPTDTPTPTQTAPPPTATATPTPVPQPLLLRRACGRDYVVRAGEPIEIFYGGWGVIGFDLAQQWATALIVDFTIDDLPIQGSQHPPSADLPYNCRSDRDDVYWIFYTASIPELAPGSHTVTVTFKALRALPDGSGVTYGPGQMAQQTFRITAQ
jgi:hypothetical protein